MNWFDYSILAILALSVLVGLWRGFVSEVLALVCWVLAFWLAWMFGPVVAELFSTSISTPSVRIILGYTLCFIGVLMMGAIVAFLMRKLVSGTGLSGTDRLLGMVFGLVRGAMLVILLVMLMKFTPATRDDWWQASRMLPPFERGAELFTATLPEHVARYLEPAATLLQHAPAEQASPALPEAPSSSSNPNPSPSR
jgi:membrane protein required for colicin V production